MKKVLFSLFFAVALFSIPPAKAQTPPQVDSLAAKAVAHDTVTAAAPGPIIPADNIDGIPIPAWLQTIVIALATLLPAVQLVLKRIPTAYSVKIGGWVGKVLDALTFFQKDKSTAPGVNHS